MRKAVLVFIVFMFFAVAGAVKAKACMCDWLNMSVKSDFDDADAVLQGKVILGNNEKGKWKIDVSKVWKGAVEQEIYVIDTSARSTCKGSFKQGDEYILFLWSGRSDSTVNKDKNIKPPKRQKGKQVFFRHACTWNTSLAASEVASGQLYEAEKIFRKKNLKFLGEGKPPIKKEKL